MLETKDVRIPNVDVEQKRKAMFVLKANGKNLTQAVRDYIAEYAKEFDEKYGKEE